MNYLPAGMTAGDLGNFNIKSAAELELRVNVLADIARANFEKFYADKMAGFIVTWENKHHRLEVSEADLDVHAITIDCAVPSFNYPKINDTIDGEIDTRVAAGKSKDQQRPICVRFRGVDYSNIDKITAALSTNSVVERLVLSGMSLEGDDVKPIAKLLETNQSVTSLDLSNNKIGSEGLEAVGQALQRNHYVTDLDVGANELGRSAMKVFGPLLCGTGLVRLLLNGNKLGLYGLEELAPALRVNNTLAGLGLCNNLLGADGLKQLVAVLWGESVEGVDKNATNINVTLTFLDVKGNKADDSPCNDDIRRGLARNRDIQLVVQLQSLEEEGRKERHAEYEQLFSAMQQLEVAAREKVKADVGVRTTAPPPAGKGKAAGKSIAPAGTLSKSAATPATSKAVKAAAAVPGKRTVSPVKKPK